MRVVVSFLLSVIFFLCSLYPSLAQRVTDADIYDGSSREPIAPAAIYLLYFFASALVLFSIKNKELRPTAFYIVSPFVAGLIVESLFGSRAAVVVAVGLYLFYVFGNWKYPT